ncbi:putative dna replication regulator sld2 protein [Rhypophila decipiens]|uniref:DNA replication regulator SLD2 n=1 Tax=Rhypophila decipiens TaxID=261697 RepID=A0AAN6YFX3_9PEZI|nr:putative dna replication regulator sld2 protein [Rhypophila decipiens]
MKDDDRSTYELRCNKLRAELKQWENEWAKTSGGKKPSREDIKQNSEISNKYKEYNNLRDTLAGKIKPTKTLPSAARHEETVAKQEQRRKRKQDRDIVLPPSRTPQKRSKHAQTPLKSQTYADVEFSAAVSPSLSRKLFGSPELPTSVDPTPQRDGRVLGLWDLLSATPSRSTGDDATSSKNTRQTNATPSKHNGIPDNDDALATANANRLNRTPNSSRMNKFLLDELPGMMTPIHKRDRNLQPTDKTPSSRSVSKLHFATPAFLRRSTAPLPAVGENGEWKVHPIKLPRKPNARGLSNMVASLRKLEEEALDDGLEVMREMEMEAEARESLAPGSKPIANVATAATATGSDEAAGAERTDDTTPTTTVQQEKIVPHEEEQQRPERPLLLGGFDDEVLYDSEEEQQLDRGQPLRVFKKKGQKRTTRKVKMKPSIVKRQQPIAANGDDDDKDDDDEVLVPETQFDSTKSGQHLEEGNALLLDEDASGSEFDDGDLLHDINDDDDDDDGTKKKKRAKLKKTPKQQETVKDKKKKSKVVAEEEEEDKENGGGIVKKTIRKVKATAFANFKRLKLKNNGAKGGPGHNSRFRRRR